MELLVEDMEEDSLVVHLEVDIAVEVGNSKWYE